MPSRSLGHRAPLLWLALPLAAGLIGGKLRDGAPSAWVSGGAVAVAAGAVLAAWRGLWAWPFLVCSALFLTGLARYADERRSLGTWESAPPRETRATLRVDRLFPRADPRRTGGLATLIRAEEPAAELRGRRIYFSFSRRPGDPPLIRSSVVSAVGLLLPVNRSAAVDTFDGYLANAGVDFRISRGHVLREEVSASRYQRWLARAAKRLDVILGVGIPPRAAALGAVYQAMMLGKKYELSEEQDTLFMQSGTMHLFAINGLHIGVVALALQALLAVARCPRALAAALVLGVLWLDVDATGASPSAVRAFLLVACYETALVLRLRANGLAALGAAGLLILLFDPFALFSASFQMSYGAVLAILTFGLPLTERVEAWWAPFRWLPQRGWNLRHRAAVWLWRWLTGAAGIGLAAALTGAVTATTFYHTLTPGGLLTNLVLVPLASVVIVAGFVSVVVGCCGMLWASFFFNRAALVVLWTIDRIIRWSAGTPVMWWAAHWRVEWAAPLALGSLVASLLFGYATGWRRNRGGFLPPVAIVGLALLCGVRFG